MPTDVDVQERSTVAGDGDAPGYVALGEGISEGTLKSGKRSIYLPMGAWGGVHATKPVLQHEADIRWKRMRIAKLETRLDTWKSKARVLGGQSILKKGRRES